MSVDDPGIRGRVGKHANVLFLLPPFTPESETLCADHLCAHATADAGMLFVVSTQTPDDRLRTFRALADGPLPERAGFLSLGGSDRSGEKNTLDVGDDGNRTLWVERANNPGNLTEIGVVLSNALSAWEGKTGSIAVCFEPLTTLLQYAEFRQVFRFVHVFNRHVRAVDATVHFHLNPLAHDEMEIASLLTLFDAAVELDEDGNAQVRSR